MKDKEFFILCDGKDSYLEKIRGSSFLLHVCCAPCACYIAKVLKEVCQLTLFFYNPNIDMPKEYEKRLLEVKRLAEEYNIPLMVGEYDVARWRDAIKGYENEGEGGERCRMCFRVRLERTAQVASKHRFPLFATTLTVAPMKNHRIINEEGERAAKKFGGVYLPSNFKKKDGYKKSVLISKEMNLYRQDFCGCSFSKIERERVKREKNNKKRGLR